MNKLKKISASLSLIPVMWEGLMALQKSHTENQQILRRELDLIRLALGRVERRQLLSIESEGDITRKEFKAFSQFGEDGIIGHLVNCVPINRRIFVEFGVEDYSESNTRFLLMSADWSGLVIDGSDENVAKIKSSELYWLSNLKAVSSFITKENINAILSDNGLVGEIGLLSIDIDGNDYWVWDAINVVSPDIVVVEYNHRFGAERSVTIPYNPNFDRNTSGYPKIYFGASLAALWKLGKRKGYSLVGCSSNGLNAFFVRSDKVVLPLREMTPLEAFRPGKFREMLEEEDESFSYSVLQNPLVEIE